MERLQWLQLQINNLLCRFTNLHAHEWSQRFIELVRAWWSMWRNFFLQKIEVTCSGTYCSELWSMISRISYYCFGRFLTLLCICRLLLQTSSSSTRRRHHTGLLHFHCCGLKLVKRLLCAATFSAKNVYKSICPWASSFRYTHMMISTSWRPSSTLVKWPIHVIVFIIVQERTFKHLQHLHHFPRHFCARRWSSCSSKSSSTTNPHCSSRLLHIQLLFCCREAHVNIPCFMKARRLLLHLVRRHRATNRSCSWSKNCRTLLMIPGTAMESPASMKVRFLAFKRS